MKRKILKGLKEEAFRHPMDTSAILNLHKHMKKVPGLKKRLEGMLKDAESEFYLHNIADNTKLGKEQCKDLYMILLFACKILDVDPPNLFLDTNPFVNAWALGVDKPSIVFTTGLIDSFNPEEVLVILGHELGHVMCEHTFYRLLAEQFDTFGQIAKFVPWVGTLLSQGFRLPLVDWYRKSELSADRAALLVVQNVSPVIQCILKLAGGNSKVGNQINLDAFVEQADEFETLYEKQFDEKTSSIFWGFLWRSAISTHPWPAIRVKEILRWSKSEEYNLILAGEFEKVMDLKKTSGDAQRLRYKDNSTFFTEETKEKLGAIVKKIIKTDSSL